MIPKLSVEDEKKTLEELRRALNQAAVDFKEHQRDLDELVKEAPSGLPLPDGQVRIVQTGQKLKLAFEKYQEAVTRYRNFVIGGVAPEDEET